MKLSRVVLIVGSTLVVAAALVALPRGVPARAFYNPTKGPLIQRRILSGFADFELRGEAHLSGPTVTSGDPTSYTPPCSGTIGSDVKVNQNCLNLTDTNLQGRGQAENETAIAIDPSNSNHIVAGFNDYRRGDGNCYGSYSLDGGAHWSDTTVPMGFTTPASLSGLREYWEGGGDTAVAWDTRGNAYLDCQVFNRGDPPTTSPDLSSAVYLFRSTGNDAASWNFPGRPVIISLDTTGSGTAPFIDKPYMTVDNHGGSPFRDRIYVTWTTFSSDGTAYIWEAHSSDYGQSFSGPVLVSGNNATLCNQTYGLPTPSGACNENQFSDPFTDASGNLYVVFDNYNNLVSKKDNRNQVLIAKSTNGGTSFSTPAKVSDFYDLPDCYTYQGQDFGRACVPEKGRTTFSVFRATNYPSGAVDPSNGKVVVTVGSYINVDSQETNGCHPDGISSSTGDNLYIGVKTAGGCNNKILISTSTAAGGTTFNGTTTDPRAMPIVNTATAQDGTDQWWQWEAFNNSSPSKLAVSYFDRQYGTDESTGQSDVSLSSSSNLSSFSVQRATGSSMPVPTQFPDSLGNSLFYGDYTGIAAASSAYPLWMDTRDSDLRVCGSPPTPCTFSEPDGLAANDQDIFTVKLTP